MYSIHLTAKSEFEVASGFVPKKETLATMAQDICNYAWSPIIFSQGRRKEEFFRYSNIIALDFDDPDTPLQNAIDNVFCDMIHIIGTTRNHQKEKNGVVCDRYRVILPTETICKNLDQFKMTMSYAIKHHGADAHAKDGARFFFPCEKIISINPEGMLSAWIPRKIVEQKLARIKSSKKRKRHVGNKTMPRVVADWLKNGPTKTASGVTSRNYTCYRIGAIMCDCGWDLANVVDMVRGSAAIESDGKRLSDEEMTRAISNGYMRAYKDKAQASNDAQANTNRPAIKSSQTPHHRS